MLPERTNEAAERLELCKMVNKKNIIIGRGYRGEKVGDIFWVWLIVVESFCA